MNLTEQETQELINRYQLKDGTKLINYRDFINKLDTVFSDQVDPTAVIQNAKTSAVSYNFRSKLDCKVQAFAITSALDWHDKL